MNSIYAYNIFIYIICMCTYIEHTHTHTLFFAHLHLTCTPMKAYIIFPQISRTTSMYVFNMELTGPLGNEAVIP